MNVNQNALAIEIRNEFLDDNQNLISCPKCNREMEKKSAFENERALYKSDMDDFNIDFCLSCELFWLDGGELAKIQLNYEMSPKGQENKKTYVNYSKLDNKEKKEFIRTIAESIPDQSEMIAKSTLSSAFDVIVRYLVTPFNNNINP